MVCYNVNIILAHDPIFQLDVCSILLKHPSRGQRPYTAPTCTAPPSTVRKHPSRGQRPYTPGLRPLPPPDRETPLTGTATVHSADLYGTAVYCEETPLTGTATVHLIKSSLICRLTHEKHPSRGRAAYFLLRFADFCGAPRRALAKNGARRQTRLAVSSTGRASACLPLTGTHLPSPIIMGEGFFVPKNQQPWPGSRGCLWVCRKFFQKMAKFI